MRRGLMIIAFAVMALVMMALVACGPGEELTGMELLQSQYEKISAARSIEQNITIKKGDLTQFESQKTFTKTDDGYTVKGSEKRLNGSDAATMYSTENIDETVQKAAELSPSLRLNKEYFEDGYRLAESGLTAKVKKEHIKDVFNLTSGELKAPTDDLTIELSVSGERLASATITYTSDGSNVTISLTMEY